MIQAFITKSNEISGLEANLNNRKKNKNEKSEKTLLLEKVDFLKKKIESEFIFSTVNFYIF